jgi:hypothetical protein
MFLSQVHATKTVHVLKAVNVIELFTYFVNDPRSVGPYRRCTGAFIVTGKFCSVYWQKCFFFCNIWTWYILERICFSCVLKSRELCGLMCKYM